MRRRLTISMVSMVAGALLAAGLLTLLLTVVSTRNQTRKDLVRQAQSLAQGVKTEASSLNRADPAQSLRNVLRFLKAPLKLQQASVLAINERGGLFDVNQPLQAGALPSGLRAADINVAALLAGRTVSGTKGAIVYAAAPFRADVQFGRTGSQVVLRNLPQVVILTRSPPTGLRAAGPWFLIVSAVTLALSVLVAYRIGRRITRPLVAAEATTRQIAAGDLSAQVPVSRRADPETASLAHSINTMAASLARLRGMEHQFLLSVSHDLRTPLTSIRGFAEAISDGAATDVPRAAAVIASESRRLERLVGDLLDLAKLEARQFSLDLRPVNLAEVVGDTGEGFRPAADELGLGLDVSVEGAAALVRADPDRLAQVVANLVENALKYASSRVRVGATVSSAQAVVWVDDDGPGIAADDLPHVFERLFMSSRYPARRVGSGLGLAIVAELVHAMGGTVRAESPLWTAGGTRMIVTLTAVSAAASPTTTLSIGNP